MSEFRAYMRRQLAGWDPRWADEWDQAMGDGQAAAALGRIKRLGGDPDFCLYVLADYRWRRLRPLRDLRQREELLRAINVLLGASDLWARMLRGGATGLSADKMRGFLVEARLALQGVRALDDGPFSQTTTDRSPRGKAWLSDRQSMCLSLLDRHIRHGSERQRRARRVLADLLVAFGWLSASKDPERWVEKRLERIDPASRFPLRAAYQWFHEVHRQAGTPCSRACELWRGSGDRTNPPRDPAGDLFLGSDVRFVSNEAAQVRASSGRAGARPPALAGDQPVGRGITEKKPEKKPEKNPGKRPEKNVRTR